MTSFDLLRGWDGEQVVTRFDDESGAWIFVAIHSTRLGPATGGTRMKPYPSPEAALADALALARGMTYKYAAADFPRGGGKAVIAVPEGLDIAAREALLSRYGALLRRLGGLLWTGPDVGTTSEDMDIVAETGAPYVFCRTPGKGGAGSSAPITAVGVVSAMAAACERIFGAAALAGRRVLVQGAGSVGAILIDELVRGGAQVRFSDTEAGVVRRFRDERGIPFVAPESVYDEPCDLFSPCALGGVLTAETVPRLCCRAVVGAANNQLATPEDADRLASRGILYAPDFVVSIGGAVGITGIEALGWSPEEARRQVESRIRSALALTFERADHERISTEAAARRIAEERLNVRTGPEPA